MHDELQKSESLKSFSLFGTEDPLIGKVLDGRWKLVQFLGEGTMSRAYKAEHLQTGEFVVLKMLHKHISINTANIRRFDAASREVMSLRHQRVAKMLDIHLDSEGEIFLVMEYLPGESLEEVLAKVGHLPVHRTIEIFSQVCDALETAHDDGIIHRDVKPSNIMLCENDRQKDDIRVLDTGISKLVAEDEDVKSSGYITRNKEVMGSPMYMSPEQCMGKRTDIPADIYSLGCVIYEVLTGKPPFVGKNVLETAYKHMNEAPKPIAPDSAHDKVLSRLEAVIFKCLAKDPNERYQSASQVKSDLAILSSASEADWQSNTFVFKKTTRVRKRKKVEVREQKKPKMSIEIIALLGALGVICVVAIIWIVAFLNSDSTEGPTYNNDELWVIKDKGKQSEQPDYASQEDAARTEMSRAERESGPDSKEYAAAVKELARVYLNSTHWQEAQTSLTKLTTLYPKLGMESQLTGVKAELAYTNFILNKNNDARDYALASIKEIDNMQIPDDKKDAMLAMPLQVLGEIYTTSGNLDKAEVEYSRLQQCLAPFRVKNVAQFYKCSAKLADVFRRENKLRQAEDCYKEAVSYYRNNERQPSLFLAKAEYGYALVLEKENKLPEAEIHFRESLSITSNISGDKNELYAPIKKHLNDIKWKLNFWGSLMSKFSGESSN
jgi:serine/threonine protein kinase